MVFILNEKVVQDIHDVFFLDSSVDLVYANISFFKSESEEKIDRLWISKPYYNQFFEDGEVPPHPSLFVKQKVYQEIGNYYPDFKIASDYEFMLRAMKVNGYKSVHLNQNIVKMRLRR